MREVISLHKGVGLLSNRPQTNSQRSLSPKLNTCLGTNNAKSSFSSVVNVYKSAGAKFDLCWSILFPLESEFRSSRDINFSGKSVWIELYCPTAISARQFQSCKVGRNLDVVTLDCFAGRRYFTTAFPRLDIPNQQEEQSNCYQNWKNSAAHNGFRDGLGFIHAHQDTSFIGVGLLAASRIA